MTTTPFPELLIIYRGMGADDVLAATEALHQVGVTAFEVTVDSPGAFTAIAGLADRFGGRARIGAGTVRTTAEVRVAAEAGASFLLSPHLDEDVVAATKRAGLFSIPGALTPTEVVRARAAGADMVKIFPVGPVGGAAYIRQLRGPLGAVPFMATGGVTAEMGEECLAAGCASIAAGAGLVGADAVRNRDWARLAAGARRYLATLRGDAQMTKTGGAHA